MQEPLSVLLIVSSLAVDGPLGGVARFVVELARAFDRARVRPAIAALWNYGTPGEAIWQEKLVQAGIPTAVGAHWDEARPYWSCVQALRGLHASSLPAATVLLHSHGEFSDLAAWWMRRRFRGRILVRTVHNEIEWPKRRHLGRLFGGMLLPLVFDAEWGVSQTVVERLNRRTIARWRARPAEMIPNALNFQRFAWMERYRAEGHRLRIKLGIPQGASVLGTVGRLVPQKGHLFLLEAFAQVQKHLPHAHLIVAGSGPLEGLLHGRAVELGIDQAVHWLGPRQDVEVVLGAFDLFVSSSLWEGLPTVILEALAAGIPVVATQVSGSAELVQSGVHGVLVPPGDAQALAQGILQAMEHLTTLRSQVQAMRPSLEQRFSIQQVARQYEGRYRSLAMRGLRATTR